MRRRTKAANEGDVGVLRCPLYVPARPTALKRLLHLASFSLSSSVAVLAQWRWKPELVVRVVPTLFCAPQALLLAKLAGAMIVGEGVGKRRRVEMAERKALRNVQFAPLQPYEALPVLLASADGHLVIQKRGAADAVLPSKLTNILAAGGNAVITADADTTLGVLCREHPGIALRAEPESVSALIEGIERCLAMPQGQTHVVFV